MEPIDPAGRQAAVAEELADMGEAPAAPGAAVAAPLRSVVEVQQDCMAVFGLLLTLFDLARAKKGRPPNHVASGYRASKIGGAVGKRVLNPTAQTALEWGGILADIATEFARDAADEAFSSARASAQTVPADSREVTP